MPDSETADLKQELLAAGYGVAGEAEALQRDTDGRPVLGARDCSPRRRRQTRGQQPQRTSPQLLPNHIEITIYIIKCCSCRKRQCASADKLQAKAAEILPLVGLARPKQDPINYGHGAQYLLRHALLLPCRIALLSSLAIPSQLGATSAACLEPDN